jgi:hypothetical protein
MNINLLAEKLQKRYPQSVPNEDWRIVVNTSGVASLSEWKLPVPKPTLEEVDSRYTDEEILTSRPGRETAVTKNPNTDAILRLIAQFTNTPYATVVSELKKIL